MVIGSTGRVLGAGSRPLRNDSFGGDGMPVHASLRGIWFALGATAVLAGSSLVAFQLLLGGFCHCRRIDST